MNFRYGHLSIRVLDLEKSLKFYVGELGMEETRRKDYPDDFCLVFLSDKNKNFELELTYNYGREEKYEIGNGFAHIAFYVPDLEKAHDGLENKGYKVTDYMGLKGDKPGYFFVTDPDGYDIEIIREKK